MSSVSLLALFAMSPAGLKLFILYREQMSEDVVKASYGPASILNLWLKPT